jgi:hypothetical protein
MAAVISANVSMCLMFDNPDDDDLCLVLGPILDCAEQWHGGFACFCGVCGSEDHVNCSKWVELGPAQRHHVHCHHLSLKSDGQSRVMLPLNIMITSALDPSCGNYSLLVEPNS